MKKSVKISILIYLIYFFGIPVALAYNQPPVADIQMSASSIYACGFITFDGSASADPDGNVASWRWTVKADRKTSDLGSGKVLIFGPPYTLKPNSYEMTLTVTDNLGAIDSRTVTFWVDYNQWPRIDHIDTSGLNGTNNWIYEGGVFDLNAVLDPSSDDDPSIWQWHYDKSIFRFSSDTVPNPEIRVISAPAYYETYSTLRAEVTDTCGHNGTLDIIVAAKKHLPNSPPVAKISVPDVVGEEQNFVLDGSASTTGNGYNEQDDTLTYYWQWNKQGDKTAVGKAGGVTPTISIYDGGYVYEIHLTVTDSFGAVDTAATTVYVNKTRDDPPVADASATARTAVAGANFSLNGSRSYDKEDFLDRGIQSYTWEVSATFGMAAWSDTVRSNNPAVAYRFTRTGEYTVKLTVRDASWQESTDTINILVSGTVNNVGPPPANAVSPAGTIPVPQTLPLRGHNIVPVSGPYSPPVIPLSTPVPKTNAINAPLVILVFFAVYLRVKRR